MVLLSRSMSHPAPHPLAKFRNKAKLSRAELALLAGTTRQTIHRIEAGEQTPSLALVRRLVSVAADRGQKLRADDFMPAAPHPTDARAA